MDQVSRALLAVGGGVSEKIYVDDVFSTYLYEGDGTSARAITNNIDLTAGGLIWLKDRGNSIGPFIFDTIRGADQRLTTSSAGTSSAVTDELVAFNSSGFSVGSGIATNWSTRKFVSWTFKKSKKFFDIVTYTGNGTNQPISHSLGSKPGMIIVKAITTATYNDWAIWTRINDTTVARPATVGIPFGFNTTNTGFASTTEANGADQSTFNPQGLFNTSAYNENGVSYIAYLFAHDTTSDGIIQCGSYTGGDAQVTTGWEPQWLLIKNISGSFSWRIVDNMRNLRAPNSDSADGVVYPNSTSAELSESVAGITSTGWVPGSNVNNGGNTYIYVAIRRPNKPPTTGTQVFLPVAQTGEAAFNIGFPVDTVLERDRGGSVGYVSDRLRGGSVALYTDLTNAETGGGPAYFDSAGGTFRATFVGGPSPSVVYWNFRRAPGFFDTVCYSGNSGVIFGSQTVSHSLGVAPELVIIKARNSTTSGQWLVCSLFTPTTQNVGYLHTNAALNSYSYGSVVLASRPTASSFAPVNQSAPPFANNVNESGVNYVAYLFASLPGISKVGSYTGNGSSQTINCGFTTGARFVLIKRTDSTGDWYVWDTARGIVAGNDPHLSVNQNGPNVEVTTNDSIDPNNTGFIVNQDAATNINVTSATYLYLAIA
jgi:hypothetical protein